MNYNEWLELIDQVKSSNRNTIYLQKMLDAENNLNINEMLQPKLVDLITEKMTKSIKKIMNNLNDTFHNPNTLDLTINTFEKDIEYVIKLCQLKQINESARNDLLSAVYEQRNKVFDILIEKSLEVDRTGMYKLIIERKKNSKR